MKGNMINIIIIILLLLGFFNGKRHGFILQAIKIVSFAVAAGVAYLFYTDLAAQLTKLIPYPSMHDNTYAFIMDNNNMETAFYRIIAFAIIFFIVRLVLRVIGSTLSIINHIPILGLINRWAGGILGFVEVYLILFILLFIGSILPVDSVQTALNHSMIAKGMINNTPYISQQVQQWWMK
ncbi:hypothetical protein G4D61_13080 [Bacillus ginsengihumi]|uniref:Colicin V production protein n=2 Tax=Heyndrickxia ginsengihumi TaxID=363870 RepID=A0A6M0P867_9BACI|nr:hypothetical protein [Heyndrickxia ginsengihumi]